MSENISKRYQQLAFELFKDLKTDELEYVYRGSFSKSITRSILGLAEINIDKAEGPSAIKKRIYFIMVEGLQNITRHQDEMDSGDIEEPGLFVIQRKSDEYFITTGNVIENQNVEPLRGKLEKVNSLAPDELKSYYRQILTKGKISDKGGAGLGLIEMARKSGNKLLYDFKKIDSDYAFFYFQTEIPSPRRKKEQSDAKQNATESRALNYIKNLHSILNQENIVISFKGLFDQDNLLSLLTIFEGQMKESVTSIKVYNIMVEMLQNIVKHGYNHENPEMGNPGIFFINEKNNRFFLTSGNYIDSNKVERLKEKIEFVNNMSQQEVTDHYDRVILNMAVNDPKKTGLGFLDMRIKSKQKVFYEFHQQNDGYTLFILQTSIGVK